MRVKRQDALKKKKGVFINISDDDRETFISSAELRVLRNPRGQEAKRLLERLIKNDLRRTKNKKQVVTACEKFTKEIQGIEDILLEAKSIKSSE